MFFQTNTTVSLIVSILTFLTNKSLCSTTQQVNTQNAPDLQDPSQDNGPNKNESLVVILKNMTYSEIERREVELKEVNEKYEKLQESFEKEKTRHYILALENILKLGKYVLQIKKDFTEEKYRDFLKYSNDLNSYLRIARFTTFEWSNNGERIVPDDIKEYDEIPEKSDEIFTDGVVDEEEKKKRINIIKKVNESIKNNLTKDKTTENNPTKKESSKDKGVLKKVFIWGGGVLVVLTLVVLLIVIFKRRGN